MKSMLTFLIGLLFCFPALAQTPVEVTPVLQNKILLGIEKEIPNKKILLEKGKSNAAYIEFELDTFRVERYMEEYIKLDFSGIGMREATFQGAKMYDSLLNKFYKKLSAVLKGEDKKVLVQAQKSWIAFRDSEYKLVGIISKDEYSGGGTMQQLTEASEYLNLVRSRTVALFDHYVRATQSY